MTQPLYERLKEARIAAGYPSARKAAQAFGWNEATYRHHENGTRNFGRDHADGYGRAFQVSPAWLSGWLDSPALDDEEASSLALGNPPPSKTDELQDHLSARLNLTLIRVYDLKDFSDLEPKFPDISLFPQCEPRQYIALTSADVAQMANLAPDLVVGVRVDNFDMAPTIQSGALVLVDLGHTEVNSQDHIWLFTSGNSTSLRRFQPIERFRVSAYADDRSIPARTIILGHVKVHGKVVWLGQRL